MGFKIPCLAHSLESHSTPLTPIPCPLTLPHRPSCCALAHRINKGNSKNIISKEKQFFLQQASLSVLLGALKKQSRRKSWNLALSVNSQGAPGLSTRHSHCEPRLRSITRVSVPQSGTKSHWCAHRLLLHGSGRTSEGRITRLPFKGKSPLPPRKPPLISKTENLMILWRRENASQRRVPS